MLNKKTGRDDRYSDTSATYEDDASYSSQDYDTTTSDAAESDYSREMETGHTESVLDAMSSFDGRYDCGQDLRVLGSLSGEVNCRGVLTLERDAVTKAKIQTRDANIRGRLEGDIVCSGRLVIASTAVVSGTIKAAALVVEEGATISGMVETTPAATAAATDTSSSSSRSTSSSSSDKDKDAKADSRSSNNGASGGRWTKPREVPSFALVSNEEKTSLDRN